MLQDARRAKLERMGEEILDLWQQLGVGKDEQVMQFGWSIAQNVMRSSPLASCVRKYYSVPNRNKIDL